MKNYQTITAQNILILAEAQVKTQGKLAVAMREACKAQDFKVLLDAFKLSLAKHGQRSKANENNSTPTDSIRSTINNVTGRLAQLKVMNPADAKTKEEREAIEEAKAYPFDGALGVKTIDGEITLYDKGAREPKAKRYDFNKLASRYTTDAQKRKALADFAKALGLES